VNIAKIRLAVGEHIINATKALHHPRLDDELVHDARKHLKRARSDLRLLRPLDERAYRRENARLRDAARQLSDVRDDKVLLAVLAELLADEQQPDRRRLLERLQARLAKARERHWRAVRASTTLADIRAALGESARHVGAWREPHDAASAPAAALRRMYRKGRKAVKRSAKDPSDEQLHEARKQVKHLAHVVELLARRAPPKPAKKAIKRASALGDYLGEDHDLAVVEARVLQFPAAPARAKRALRRRLEKRRARLQKKALKTARKLFRKKTKSALRRVA
jgi:CHAD domain-containing protein